MIGLDTWKAFVPLHAITRVASATGQRGSDTARIHTADGNCHETSFARWEEFLRSAVQLVPVVPGMSLLRIGIYDDEPANWWLEREPVIAWALCVDGETRPATPAGVWDGLGWETDPGPFVEMPGGKVINTWRHGDYGSFPDADQLVRQLLKDAGKDPAKWRSTAEVPL